MIPYYIKIFHPKDKSSLVKIVNGVCKVENKNKYILSHLINLLLIETEDNDYTSYQELKNDYSDHSMYNETFGCYYFEKGKWYEFTFTDDDFMKEYTRQIKIFR